VVLLIAGVSTIASVQGTGNVPSLTNAFARAFGVVNANAATSGGFSTVPATPQGSRHLTCPTSAICYLESINIVNTSTGATAATVYKTIDGGMNWTPMTMPLSGFPDTAFACSSVSVCSVGFLQAPASSPAGLFPQGTTQTMLTTTDGGTTWSSHVVTINPVVGDDAALDASLVDVQGQWSQLQCFSATSCVAVAWVPSDQPQEPLTGGDTGAVQRTAIMRTNDGGASWTTTVLPWSNAADGSPGWSNLQPFALACASATSCLGLSTVMHSVVNNSQSSNVKVWRSSDGGTTWQGSWAPASAIALDQATSFTCPTTLRCYATVQTGAAVPGRPEVMTTDDGGTTWSFEDPAATVGEGSDIELVTLSCADASTCWTAGEERLEGTDRWRAAIWATSDSGGAWLSVPLPSGLGFVFQVVCNPPDSCLAVAQPPFKSGQAAPSGPLPGEILSNQS
jgi:hypothetical protein